MNNLRNKTGFLVASVALLISLVGCTSKPERVEYWMSYDDIDLMASPSDTAAVVKQLNGRVSPFNIEQRDSTGEWGLYVVSRGAFSKIVKGWLPLKDMIYAGSDDPDERYEAYVVKPKDLPMYRHPRVNKKDVYGSIHAADTVLATANLGKWMHVYHTKFSQTGRQAEHYGWVQTSQLQKIDSMSRNQLTDNSLATSITAKAKDSEEAKYLEFKQQNHVVYSRIGVIVGYIALAMAVIMLVPAIKRKKFWDIVLLVVIGLVLIAFSQSQQVITWWYSFAVLLMALVLCYPLLYFRTSAWFGYIFVGLVLAGVGYYVLLCTNLLHFNLWRLLLFLLLLAIVALLAHFIYKRIERDICPHCGYYARHSRDGRRQVGSTTSHGTETKDEFVKTTREKIGNTEYITDHYNRVTYDTKTTTRFFEVDRTCMRCGETFQNREESKNTTRTRR